MKKYFVPFEFEVWGEKDEPATLIYYYSGFEDGTVTDTSRSLYGQFDVNFCLKAKDGVKVKLMRYYDYASIEELEEKFHDVAFLSRGTRTEAYKLVEGNPSLPENRFLLECKLNEKVYYAEAPVKDAIKDESTGTTAYNWYKEGTKRVSGYSSTAPKGYPDATKTSDSRWTEFTDWSSKKPGSASYRKIESKTKVKLQEIQGTNENSFEEIGS